MNQEEKRINLQNEIDNKNLSTPVEVVRFLNDFDTEHPNYFNKKAKKMLYKHQNITFGNVHYIEKKYSIRII